MSIESQARNAAALSDFARDWAHKIYRRLSDACAYHDVIESMYACSFAEEIPATYSCTGVALPSFALRACMPRTPI